MAFNFDRREVNRTRFAEKIRTRTEPKANRAFSKRELQQIQVSMRGIALDTASESDFSDFENKYECAI